MLPELLAPVKSVNTTFEPPFLCFEKGSNHSTKHLVPGFPHIAIPLKSLRDWETLFRRSDCFIRSCLVPTVMYYDFLREQIAAGG